MSGSGALSAALTRFPPVRTVGRVVPLMGYYRPRRTGLRQLVKTVQLTQWVRVHVRKRVLYDAVAPKLMCSLPQGNETL